MNNMPTVDYNYVETDAEVLEREEAAAVEENRRRDEVAANPLIEYTDDELMRREHLIQCYLSEALAGVADEQFAYRHSGPPLAQQLQERADALKAKLEECNAELQRRTKQS